MNVKIGLSYILISYIILDFSKTVKVHSQFQIKYFKITVPETFYQGREALPFG